MDASTDQAKTPLVVFGEDWGGLPSSTQHLIRGLESNHAILWINSLGLRRPRLTRHDLLRLWNKGKRLLSPKGIRAQPSDSFRSDLIEPNTLPLPGNPIARQLNRALLGPRIRARCETCNLQQPILWASLPSAVDLVGSLNERAVVYYCGDDFGALCGVDHQAVLRQEQELVAKADLILVASEKLMRRFPADKTRLLPHGVDFELFSRPAPRAKDLSNDKPVAGFYGSLSDWIDIELLTAAASQHPHWNFCLIGQIQTDISPLNKLPNVQILGPRPHHQLAGYIQHWQAALLPFRDTPQIRACNPLKLREYLASGTPVISTDFPALNGYRDLVSVITPEQGIAQALQQCLSEPQWVGRWRQRRVQSESWQQRCAELESLLSELG